MSRNRSVRPLERLATRVFNTPLMIEPTKAEIISAALQQRLGIAEFERINGTTLGAAEMQALAGDARREYGENYKPYHMDGRIAVVPVDGTLVHKYGWLDPMSGMTGYDGIAKKLRAAMKDDDVKAIWLDIDSPGGEVSGCFTLVEEIAMCTESEGGKPIWGFVNEQACSAAYAIASVCDRVYGPMEAMVGSIGCYTLHVDFTKKLDKDGLKVTMIRAGERKAIGAGGIESLDKAQVEKLQAWVDRTRQRFAELVAMGRGIPVKDVLATEGDWFDGRDAVALKLMDGVMSEAEAWGALEEHIARKA